MSKIRPIFLRFTVPVFAFLNLLVVWLLSVEEATGWLAGYFLGLFAVVIHFVSTGFTEKSRVKDLTNVFFFSLFVRFLIVGILFFLILVSTKIDEFGFTVSFIISYIFHSVNEVIFLNRKFSN